MTSRRKFIGKMAVAGISTQINWFSGYQPDFARNDWKEIRNQFPVSKSPVLNLNSGSAGSMPYPVLEELVKKTHEFNNNALYKTKELYENDIYNAKVKLSNFLGCTPEELALTKNTTESLSAIIWGLPLDKKDEVIFSKSDYPFLQTFIKKRSEKEGFKTNEIELDLPYSSDEDIIERYRNAINNNTKLIVVTMITHREGQILPVKKICQLARENNIEVLVDAAHAPGQVFHSFRDLGCDYYTACLHKWMNGPFGTGLIIVNKEKIGKLNPPAFPYPEVFQNSIRKFDYSGTTAFQNLAVVNAVMDFNQKIDRREKEAHLKNLTAYWTEKVEGIKGAKIITDVNRSAALSGFNIEGINLAKMKRALFEQHKINIKLTSYKRVGFFRVSTNIFTDEKDLDRFVNAVESIVVNHE
ncbi:MAG: aminotransferase class V-fold PLP-dependent enzyme [Bacteroidia bacterium]|nr:aminotransferase class V-fold PLP-dependent enzyme [Bacteroidia bacterium]